MKMQKGTWKLTTWRWLFPLNGGRPVTNWYKMAPTLHRSAWIINIDPITSHALRLNMAISLLSKASAASPTWTQEYRGYLSMRLQRKLHNNTLKVTVLSVQVKQKQTQWEWVQSEPYECHSQSIRPSPPSWMAVISCHDSPHRPMKSWQLVRISFISF